MGRAIEVLLGWVGRVIYAVGLGGWFIRRGRNRPKILLYHACAPTESDFIRGLGSNTYPEAFASQMDFVQRHYAVVRLAALEEGDAPAGPVAAITFDDGYRSVLTHALPILEARALPATLYLATGVLEGDAVIWVNELAWLLNRHPQEAIPAARARLGLSQDAEVGTLVLEARNRDPAEVGELLDDIWSRTGADRAEMHRAPGPYITWTEAREMAERGFDFGAHTVRHPSLPSLDADELQEEISRSVDAIRDRLGPCSSFSYPFGDLDDRVPHLAGDMGFRSLVEVGGPLATRQEPPRGRVPVTATSDSGFFAQVEVVYPVKGWLKRLLTR